MPIADPLAPSRRDRQRAETRERIYEAALAEFLDVGFAQAQIPRIAAAAGVVRGTFYFHFPSKEHVLQEAADRNQAAVSEALHKLRGTDASLEQVLLHLIETVVAAQEGFGDDALMRDVLSMYVRAPIDDVPSDAALRVLAELTHHLEQAMARRELRTDFPAERLAATVLTSIFGTVMARPAQQGRKVDRREELARLVDLLLRGMTGGVGRP